MKERENLARQLGFVVVLPVRGKASGGRCALLRERANVCV